MVALAALAKVPIKIVDRLMGGDRPDPVLILCKAANLSWPTVKALILVRPDTASERPLRRSMPPLPIMDSFRRPPRIAWFASGRCGRVNNRPITRRI